MDQNIRNILSQYDLGGSVTTCEAYGNGHINWTYDIKTDNGKRYILQRINTYVFRDPVGLMRNTVLLTDFMRKKVDDPRKVLQLIPTKSGEFYFVNEKDEYWRIFVFVENCICYDKAESLELFRESGRAFGNFQNLLADFPVDSLIETIPDFHNTPERYRAFEEALAADTAKRAGTAKAEIGYVLSQKQFASFLLDKVKDGVIPLRVTHNDTKINNVLFDKDTNEALCIVDLDTTMPGIAAMDFGDCIRYAGNNAAEDEKDLNKVFLRMDLFRAFAEGFCTSCKESLSREELLLCPEASKMITLETGVRFLADYLQGDVYFHIAYPEHNLDRARVQFRLAADMDDKMEAMRDVIISVLDNKDA